MASSFPFTSSFWAGVRPSNITRMVCVVALSGNSSSISAMPCFMGELSGRYFVMSAFVSTRGINRAQTTTRTVVAARTSARLRTMKSEIVFTEGLSFFGVLDIAGKR